MSYQPLLCHNKLLAFFTLDLSTNTQQSPILQPSIYTTMIYHFHYPVVYFQQLYQHFKHCLPHGTKPGNLRLYLGSEGSALPSELPVGLFVRDYEKVFFRVGVDLNYCLLDAFKIVKTSWKKAFEVVNPNQKCDYVKSRISQAETQNRFQLYKQGCSHRFQKEGKYEGTVLMVKGKFQDIILERKYPVTEFPQLKHVVKDLFCLTPDQMLKVNTHSQEKQKREGQGEEKKQEEEMVVWSHTLEVDLEMSTKLFLDEWSYNDGYCYLVLQQNSSFQRRPN